VKVAKWGNSLAIRLPAPVGEMLNLKRGDEIERLLLMHDRQTIRGLKIRNPF
jgi:antitoxin component of MazEF toxin-antitoxin module